MKVLMFGWEFPPHISGGLGTACAGLTRALEKADVDVLFVIPRLQGNEQADRTTFINASSIPIRQKKYTPEKYSTRQPEISEGIAAEPRSPYHTIHKSNRQTIVEVPAALTAYVAPEANLSLAMEAWNYTIGSVRSPESNRSAKQGNHPLSATPKATYVKEPFPFSGTYGQNLLEEVSRYSETADEIARRHTFDVIHAHDWMTYPAGIAAKKRSGKPLVVHVHATEVDRSGDYVNAKVFALEKEGMEMADQVITVSQWTKNIAIKHYGIDERKILVIHNGITPRADDHQPFSATPFDTPVVTFLGRITHQKGPMYFVEAARKVHGRLPDVHFVVAGAGDQLPNMIERIAQAKLSERFHFTGFLRGSDVDRVWAMSNVYVMPSVSEPFGIAPLEAIQAGVPVILSKQAGVSEVMPHAIKIDFWNTEALAEAICSLLRFKSLANTLKRNGADHIKNITWDNAAKKLTTLYHELTAKHERTKTSDPLLPGTSAKKAAAPAVL